YSAGSFDTRALAATAVALVVLVGAFWGIQHNKVTQGVKWLRAAIMTGGDVPYVGVQDSTVLISQHSRTATASIFHRERGVERLEFISEPLRGDTMVSL